MFGTVSSSNWEKELIEKRRKNKRRNEFFI
jgi:hypothetical protein